MSEQRPKITDSRAGEGFASPTQRFHIAPGDLLRVFSPAGGVQPEPLEPDEPEHAIGRRIARLDVEPEFATAYLTFDDGTYLVYAARIDEEGMILLDRFCDQPAQYNDYFIFDELEGETGPPPSDRAPQPGTPFHPEAWRGAVGRTVHELGWDEEGLQAFIHFEEGGYLTLAARASGGATHLLGYFAASDPTDDEGYFEFEPPEAGSDD